MSNALAGILGDKKKKTIQGHQVGKIVVFNTESISSFKHRFKPLSVNPHDTSVREGMSAAAAEMKL